MTYVLAIFSSASQNSQQPTHGAEHTIYAVARSRPIFRTTELELV